MSNESFLHARAVRTRVFHPGQDLAQFLRDELTAAGASLEGAILAVTSKIVSLAENRVLPKSGVDKKQLVKNEADRHLGSGGHGVELTIKHGLLIPSAGIDESNAAGDFYILYPENPYASAEKIWRALKDHFRPKEFGVIITDSHTTPLRNGVSGIGLSHWGFKATSSRVGQADIFGRPLKFTHINVLDSLSAAAVYAMGEANEQCPIALLRASGVTFTDQSSPEEIKISPDDDLYSTLLR